MKKIIQPPDQWTGWRRKEDGSIDYSTEDLDYLKQRFEYLKQFIFNGEKKSYTDESMKLFTNKDQYSDRQILAWGCGSGKTLKLIVFGAMLAETALIVLNTNEEVEKLVFDIKALNPNQSIVAYTKDINADKVEEDIYYLSNFKILVTNNWRFLNDPRHVLMTCYSDLRNTYLRLLKSSTDVSRKYIIFDEFPQLFTKNTVDSRAVTLSLFDIFSRHIQEDGGIINRLLENNPLDGKQINIISDSLDNDPHFVNSVLGEYPTKSNIVKERRLAKVAYVINEVAKDFNSYLKNPRNIEWIDTVETIADFNTKIFILDATGDILFKTSKIWSVSKEYVSTIRVSEINHIDMDISRNRSTLSVNEHYDRLLEQIAKLDNYLKDKSDRKHLVVTWKDSKGFDLPKLIKDRCTTNNFYITHYGSGKTRATNEFIDCDSIIFFGDWYINREVVTQLSELTQSDISSSDLVLAEMVQAVFRTRARNLKLEDRSIIIAIDSTMNIESNSVDLKDRLISEITTGEDLDIVMYNKRIRFLKSELNKQTFDKLDLFFYNYPNYKAVFQQVENFEITLNEINKTIPYAKKRVKSYDKLKELLFHFFNINLIIS